MRMQFPKIQVLTFAVSLLLCSVKCCIIFVGPTGYGKTTACIKLTDSDMETRQSTNSVTQKFNQAEYKGTKVYDTVGFSNNIGDESQSQYTGDNDAIADICFVVQECQQITALVYFSMAQDSRLDDIVRNHLTSLGKIFPGVPMYIQNTFNNPKLKCSDNTEQFISEAKKIRGINIKGYSCFDPIMQTEQFKSFYDDIIANNTPQQVPEANQQCQAIPAKDPKYQLAQKKKNDCKDAQKFLEATQAQLVKYDEKFCKISQEERQNTCITEYKSIETRCQVKKDFLCGTDVFLKIFSTPKICSEVSVDPNCLRALLSSKNLCIQLANQQNLHCMIQMNRNKDMLRKKIQEKKEFLVECPFLVQ